MLPVLDEIRIASPCHEPWDSMTGDARVRHCAACDRDVFNLSAMTRPEAESLLAARTGRTCIRLYRRADGTVLTQDCPVGWRKARRAIRRRVMLSAIFVLGLAGIGAGAAAKQGHRSDDGDAFDSPLLAQLVALVRGQPLATPTPPPMPPIDIDMGIPPEDP